MEDFYEHLDPSIVYTSSSIPGSGCPDYFYEEFLEGCICTGTNCLEHSCTCLKDVEHSYDEDKKLKWPLSSYPIFECNTKCNCSQTCKNRVIQKGPTKNIYIKQVSEQKGLGLFCKNDILKGTFVCTYSGEVIGVEEGRKRAKAQQDKRAPNFILSVKEYFSTGPFVTVIDPTVIGNIGRYCNHSCDPNLFMIPIRIENMLPHLALFASKNVAAETELTFDYGNPSRTSPTDETANLEYLTLEEKQKLVICSCDAKDQCRKYLPFHK